MRRTALGGALMVVAAGVGAAASADDRARAAQSSGGVQGRFQMIQMMHVSTAQFGQLPRTQPWDGTSLGNFGYSGIPCTGNAPVNNLGSNLPSYNGRVAGSRLPSSTRMQPLAFTVVRSKSGGREMRARMTLVVCHLRPGPTANPDPVPDAEKPRIIITFRAPFTRESSESVTFAGRFKIVGGTQRYEDITGSGRVNGNLFCLGTQTCAQRGGMFYDGQLTLQGTYRDPTPQL
jgi:hypothetical protein